MRLVMNNGTEFRVEFAGPSSITENMVFVTKILDSDIDTVHNTFKDPENTRKMTHYVVDTADGIEYVGYTRYSGFTIDTDGGILVILKKEV